MTKDLARVVDSFADAMTRRQSQETCGLFLLEVFDAIGYESKLLALARDHNPMKAPIVPVLDAAAVEASVANIDVLGTLRALFRSLAEGCVVQPPQSLCLFPNDRGDYITYGGVLADRDVFGAKVSPYIVGTSKPIVTAWTLLMSMKTGLPLLICDAGRLTVERTGGTTALAVDYLARTDATRLAIIGSGPIALAHWKHVSGLRPWSSIRLWSPSLASNAERRGAWAAACPNALVAEDARSACHDADVIMLCTSSGTPVIDTAALTPGTLVTSISTNVSRAHEVDPRFLTEAQVYCDYRQNTPSSAGEMLLAKEQHGWDPAAILGDLASMMSGQVPRPVATLPVFFRSIGLGIADVAMAEALHRMIAQRA